MLTDVACRKALPGPTDRKIADSGGLFLFVTKNGHKSWRWKYRFGGKEKLLVIGAYPEISLRDARELRDAARRLLKEGIDPAVQKKLARAQPSSASTFRAVTLRWHGRQTGRWTPRYADQVLSRLEENVFQFLAHRQIDTISPADVLTVLHEIEQRGAFEMTKKVRMHMSEVFCFGIASGLCNFDPATMVRKALTSATPTRHPAYLKIEAARSVLLGAEQLSNAGWSTLLASRLIALTAVRPDMVRQARPGEFEDLEGDQPVWRIPARRIKLRRSFKNDSTYDFLVPLSVQAVATVKVALAGGRGSPWAFPSIYNRTKPQSNATLSRLYRKLGHTGKHVPHGWRSTFSTIMNERAARQNRPEDREIIDMMLAHVQSGVEIIYNRAAYMERRREIAQEWADLLMEGLPAPATLLLPSR